MKIEPFNSTGEKKYNIGNLDCFSLIRFLMLCNRFEKRIDLIKVRKIMRRKGNEITYYLLQRSHHAMETKAKFQPLLQK